MDKIKSLFKSIWNQVIGKFVMGKTTLSNKIELNKRNIMFSVCSILVIFVILGLFMPSEDTRVFHEVAEQNASEKSEPKPQVLGTAKSKDKSTASILWNGGGSNSGGSPSQNQINYNTAMVIGAKKGNAKDQLHAGLKIRLQNVDKFIASQDGTPMIARSLETVSTESGFIIPEGSIFYGEASYQSSSNKAQIKFNRISFPDGRIQDIQATAVDSSGQAGLNGDVKSDAVKNSAGQILTTFVGGLAAGSVSRDMFGQSAGGIQNGLLQALSDTAKDRATQYGEKMKEAREWIEIESGVYFEAVILQAVNLKQELDQGGYHE